MTSENTHSHKIYGIGCSDCISYKSEPGYQATISGLINGEEQEFNTLDKANAAITLHAKEKPLHKPYLHKPVIEYIVSDMNHMIRYRGGDGKEFDHSHVYSVDGFKIASDKHAYECMECGAIYQSKDARDRTVFPTDDPRCSRETHKMKSLSNRICQCPTIWELDTKEG
jgi:hypothetical protein